MADFGDFQSEQRHQFGEMFGGMSYGLQTDFSAYDPSNFFHSLRIQAVEDGIVRTFEELGTGQEQLLSLAFAQAYAKAFYGGIFLAIEEPEAHLHPLAQEWLSKKIKQMSADGMQLLITTHSPAFVDFLGLQGCVLVRKSERATVVNQMTRRRLVEYCLQHGAHPARTHVDTILPFYENSATQPVKAGLFAKRVILVEGMAEALALAVYLGKAGLDVTKVGIAIIPVMGKGNLAKWWRFYTAFEIPTYVVFDNDLEDDMGGEKREDVLRAGGASEEDLQVALGQVDWTVFPSHTVFGVDFETTLRTSFGGYEDVEREGKSQLGDSKPLVARYVAERLTRDDTQVGWQRVAQMVTALERLEIGPPADEGEGNGGLPF